MFVVVINTYLSPHDSVPMTIILKQDDQIPFNDYIADSSWVYRIQSDCSNSEGLQ